MTPRRSACVTALLLALGCGGPAFRGGRVVPPETPLRGRVLRRLVPEHCRDAAGSALRSQLSEMALCETPEGALLLWVRRANYDTLVVDNGFDTGAAWHFQLEVTEGETRIHDWQIPKSDSEPGVLRVAAELGERPRGSGFVAALGKSVLLCELAESPHKSASAALGSPAP